MRFPVVTAAVGAAVLASSAFDPLASWAIYDRAAIEGGQPWRLLTGNLVHHSAGHLLLDLSVFAGVGTWIEQRRDRLFAPLCCAAALAVGLAVYWLHPQMARFGGLSGVATAAVVYRCGREIRRPLFAAALAVVALKLIAESLHGGSVLGGSGDFVLAPASHWAGALCAALAVSLPASGHEKLGEPARRDERDGGAAGEEGSMERFTSIAAVGERRTAPRGSGG